MLSPVRAQLHSADRRCSRLCRHVCRQRQCKCPSARVPAREQRHGAVLPARKLSGLEVQFRKLTADLVLVIQFELLPITGDERMLDAVASVDRVNMGRSRRLRGGVRGR
eukprot:6011311-Prymnesium_polylepis.1